MKLIVNPLPKNYIHPQGYTFDGQQWGIFDGVHCIAVCATKLEASEIVIGSPVSELHSFIRELDNDCQRKRVHAGS